ncbi:alpha/beta fold hydrolase [Microlunatus ginsengisoli]|uniref:Alpha/beta hydrolase n=1 Tax=Microlunatus ginsengisoli TaxID=363863 RepID=A0ABP6ZJK1_9ACTN
MSTTQQAPSGAGEVRSGQLEVNGGRIYYEVRGAGPLLLVVGQPMTSGPFGPVADLLAADHTVVTYDPHGVGRSTVDDPALDVTPEIEADDLAAVIEAVGDGPADVVGSSGGAVAALALALRRPDLLRTVVAHEPPVAELLPDAAYIRTAVDGVEAAYRAGGSGAGWGAFISLVMHHGPVTEAGVAPAAWPPPGAEPDDAAPEPAEAAGPPPEPNPKQQADDELFFTKMLKPFTGWRPPIEQLRASGPRIVVAVGAASGPEIAGRATRALAEALGTSAVELPGDHAGFMADPQGWARGVGEALAAP